MKKKKTHFVMCCPAFLDHKKGHIYLLQAIKILNDEGYNKFRCCIIGDGPEKGKLKKYVANAGINKYVSFCGAWPHETIIALYASNNVDVVVLPSIIEQNGEREGIPVGLIEAMAYGIPVISTTTGGIPELLAKDSGILVQQKNIRDLAEALKLLWLKPQLLAKIAENGQRRVKKYFDIDYTTTTLTNNMM